MPNIGQANKPNLSDIKEKHAKLPPKEKAKLEKAKKVEAELAEDDEDESELDDDVIEASKKGKKENGGISVVPWYAWVAGVFLLVLIIIFLFGGRRNKDVPVEPAENPTTQEQATTPTPDQQPSEEDGTEPPQDNLNVGTQDFTADTNWKSDSRLEEPDQFVKDLYGLTTRVDYEVDNIQYAADFVNYTKHRGTWGGGMELYYLDATYRGSKYVIQVPFKYYKELSDEGIIPVKMEILRIVNEADTTGSGYLSIISYMCLDEDTLQTILKSQNK